jgi:hypothetical protein
METEMSHQANQSSVRRLFSAEDQATFLESYFVCTGRPPERQVFLRGIAADVFRRSHTAGYFVDGTMVGGYCLGLRPPLVEFDLLPPEIRESHPLLQNVAETNIASLPMLWINKDLRGPRHSVIVWKDMLKTIYGCGRDYLVYTYQLQERRNWKLYKRACRPTNVYEGLLANGGIGGVDCVPVHHLRQKIEFLTRFADRHSLAPLASLEPAR